MTLLLGILGAACSSSSDTSDDSLQVSGTGAEMPNPADDTINGEPVNEGASPTDGLATAYCSAEPPDDTDASYVLFDLPASEPFAALRDESDSLEDLSVLTQIASLASDNQAIAGSRLFCDFEAAEVNGCTMNSVPRSSVRDVVLTGQTLSFSVDTDDGQSTNYVIANRDYATASLASTTRNGSVFTLDTARDSANVERMEINRRGRMAVVTENPDCSGSLDITEGVTSTLTAEWSSPSALPLTLNFQLCDTGGPEGSDCVTDTLTVR